jgi:GABA(A) receptor-associated protein
MNNFKNKHSFEKRRTDSISVRDKYPDRIPIIVQKEMKSTLPEVDKCKYLVPMNMTMSQFSFVIRKRIQLKPHEAIFITINNSLVASSKTLSELYEEQKDEDGFLYVVYTSENTFG